jgi:hypothetical protein
VLDQRSLSDGNAVAREPSLHGMVLEDQFTPRNDYGDV